MQALVVDDDAIARRAMSCLLRTCGFEHVIQADDGHQALDVLGHDHPDLVITDCQMPRMDGISLTRALRQGGQSGPIIMLSGLEDPQIIDLAMRAGVTQYLCKPLRAQALVETINDLFAVGGPVRVRARSLAS